MPTEIQHENSKFALAGLDLNLPLDLIPPTKYAKATNVVSKIEGQLQGRDGSQVVAAISPGTPIHTIFRLQQPSPAIPGERLVGAGGNLYTAPLPAGNAFSQLLGGPTFDTAPLSIIQFRFDGDPAGIWAIIANANGMMKRRAGYYQLLGLAPPSVAASASVGGSGLLNSSTGTEYDWRYTYLNPITLSESNPSPISTGIDTVRPTANQTPDVTLGGLAFTNPLFAYDNNLATAAVGTTTAGTPKSSIRLFGWLAALNAYSAVTLYVNATATGAAGDHGSNHIDYSTDGGMTWTPVFVAQNWTNQTFSVQLPPGQDMTKLQVRGWNIGDATHFYALSLFEVWVVGVITPPTAETLALTNQSANVCVTPPTDPQETALRLYRRGGTLPNNWFYVGQFVIASLVQGSCGSGTLLINDNVPDSVAEIGQLLQIDNFQPIQSVQATAFPLPIAFGPSNGMVLACGDPARPDAVYFSQDGNADIWPAENWVVVANPGEQVMNGLEYNLRTFVFSRERMYIMLPNIIAGVTFTPAETATRRGLKGRWALAAGEQGIYFIAKDGAYRTQGGPEQSIVDDSIRPLFPTRESPVGVPVNGYDAIDMSAENSLRLAYHNGEIWFDYLGLTTQTLQRLIFDERRTRWRPGTYTPVMQMAYSEPNTTSSLLYGGTDGTLYSAGGTSDSGSAIPVEVLTGAMDQGRPLNLKEYLTINIDIDPGGATVASPVTIVPRANGGLIAEAALTIIGSGRQRVTLPLNQNGLEVYAYNLQFDISWQETAAINPILYQYETLFRWEPSELTHWELQSTSMGFEGWLHIRDGYISIRSTANVTLTITPDTGAAQTFTLPSTSGAKRKLYFQLAMNKAKSYAFALDSTAVFRVYSDESEIRCKQWLTKLGYKNIPLIGREQVGRAFGAVNV